jgi:hypothetical protein
MILQRALTQAGVQMQGRTQMQGQGARADAVCRDRGHQPSAQGQGALAHRAGTGALTQRVGASIQRAETGGIDPEAQRRGC